MASASTDRKQEKVGSREDPDTDASCRNPSRGVLVGLCGCGHSKEMLGERRSAVSRPEGGPGLQLHRDPHHALRLPRV